MVLLAGIFLFAIIITIIEFPCSAVVPVAFAGVLAQAGLSSFQYIFYISLFALFYMLDEIVVFLIAFFTMKIWLASSKALIAGTYGGEFIINSGTDSVLTPANTSASNSERVRVDGPCVSSRCRGRSARGKSSGRIGRFSGSDKAASPDLAARREIEFGRLVGPVRSVASMPFEHGSATTGIHVRGCRDATP